MINKTICIIPARGGSKRIPRKNIKLFHGKPLIGYSIETALKSNLFDKIYVSTDDKEISKISQQYGAEVIPRPKKLSDDFTTTSDVIDHAHKYLHEKGKEYIYSCTLYATAPLLQIKHLKEGFNQLINNKVKMTFSATSMPYPIQRTFKITKNNRCKMFWPENFNIRSQDFEIAYQDAGQFYWINLNENFTDIPLGKDSIPIIIPRYFVQDIDTLEDWKRAEYMYRIMKATNDEQ